MGLPSCLCVNPQSACPHALNIGGIRLRENKSQKLNIYNMSFFKLSERKRRVNVFEACASFRFSCRNLAFSPVIPPSFLFFFNVCYLLFTFKFNIVFYQCPLCGGSRNEYVFLPILFNCLHQIIIHQASTQWNFRSDMTVVFLLLFCTEHNFETIFLIKRHR